MQDPVTAITHIISKKLVHNTPHNSEAKTYNNKQTETIIRSKIFRRTEEVYIKCTIKNPKRTLRKETNKFHWILLHSLL
jgi:hypothetical protein